MVREPEHGREYKLPNGESGKFLAGIKLRGHPYQVFSGKSLDPDVVKFHLVYFGGVDGDGKIAGEPSDVSTLVTTREMLKQARLDNLAIAQVERSGRSE